MSIHHYISDFLSSGPAGDLMPTDDLKCSSLDGCLNSNLASDSVVELTPGQRVIKHMRAARLTSSEPFSLADGCGRGCLFEFVRWQGQDRLIAKLISILKPEALPHLTLCQGLTRADHLDTIIRQATELGIWRIVVFVSSRTTAKLHPGKENTKLRRWQRVARAAAEQCGRLTVPYIEPVLSLDAALALTNAMRPRLCAWEEAWEEACEGENSKALDLGSALRRGIERCNPASVPPSMGPSEVTSLSPDLSDATSSDATSFDSTSSDASLFIGPEGGFSPVEVEQLRTAGCQIFSLGARILRVDTAAAVASALALYEMGALGTHPDLGTHVDRQASDHGR